MVQDWEKTKRVTCLSGWLIDYLIDRFVTMARSLTNKNDRSKKDRGD